MSTENYYVPEQSRLPIMAATGLGTMAYGAGSWVQGGNAIFFLVGTLILAFTLYAWFSLVIKENMAGMNSDQLKRSYVWGMGWFIFSEVMFFAVFFGALYYIRNLAIPWLGNDVNALLWEGFEPAWPLMTTPDMVANGDAAQFMGPDENMSFPGWDKLFSWLPLWNTIILMSSSVTVHIAHTAIKNNNRGKFLLWLGITVVMGAIFLVLQVEEYIEAYQHMGLTLESGAYGTTFFMLTGFHGAHVTMGTIILLVQFLRGLKGHFNSEDQFGFEAASWYWHFVDVVWVGLFLFVYILA
ncbi:MAG: cytochrome c oxidase subunit 3 [Porticoccaceae bacterium]|nr:MAG: cytochrome c oxidase subunit 3 [Porticoccaceae bacterium]